ncbi:MAG: hypothetical protein MJK12_07315 [Colwellia sp.]|nr:hypothetical protein [Colwellia sp.]
MEALSTRELLLERRSVLSTSSNLWDQLTLAQKFSASSLTQFGYELAFIRESNSPENLAVLLCGQTSATITNDGEINTAPQIIIRP